MIAANYGSVADIEIMWTLIAVVGACFSLFNVREAWGDLLAARKLPDNGRKLVAIVSLREEVARFSIQMIFGLIGFFAMLLPETPEQVSLTFTQEALGAAVRWGLIISAVLVTFQSIENRRMRQHFVTQPEGGS